MLLIEKLYAYHPKRELGFAFGRRQRASSTVSSFRSLERRHPPSPSSRLLLSFRMHAWMGGLFPSSPLSSLVPHLPLLLTVSNGRIWLEADGYVSE